MRPIQGVVQITADITRPETIDDIRKAFLVGDDTHQGCCQLVVCDGAPDLSGLHEFDAHLAHILAIAALRAAASLLVPGGTFVLKVFVSGQPPPPHLCCGSDSAHGGALERPFGGSGSLLHAQLRAIFDRVALCKPRSSRVTSREHFAVCRGFRPPVAVAAPPTRMVCPARASIPARADEVVVPLSAAEGPETAGPAEASNRKHLDESSWI